jgi:hypothetical protein
LSRTEITKEKLIGFKLATESFVRAEIWVTEKPTKDGKVESGISPPPHPASTRTGKLAAAGNEMHWRAIDVGTRID